MKDKLTKVLESMNYPYFQQGTMNKEEGYPESYFTFKNMSSDGDAFYNNEEHKIVWLFIKFKRKIKKGWVYCEWQRI